MRGRSLGLPLVAWITLAVLMVVGTGAVYTVHLADTVPPGPVLPAGPPHATLLSQSSKTDLLEGNFVLTNALYRSSDPPARVVAYYTALLGDKPHQLGRFIETARTTLPSRAPEALQHVPAIFNSPTAADPRAAQYLYTEYSAGVDDVGVAIDTRAPRGPTLVYLEMLTLPN